MEFVPCTLKQLPPDMAIEAARVAVEQNPTNAPSDELRNFIVSPDHLAVVTKKYWGSGGVRLTVGFMESTPADLQAMILSHMNSWGEYANVTFVLSQSDPQVRITREQEGYWSYLGTDVLQIPRGEATMCLSRFSMQIPEGERRRVIRHEAGHTLGFPHEHMRTAIVARIDPQKAIEYFARTQGWSAAMVRSQVLTPLAESSIMGTPDADETSIMAYRLPPSITRDGRPILGGDDIAPQDAEFVGKIYPKATDPNPPQPPPPVGAKDLDLSMDFQRKQVHVRLPAGWSVHKKSSTGDTAVSNEPNQAEMNELADKLEALLPDAGAPREAAMQAQAPAAGLISSILAVVTALRSGDWKAALVAVRNLLNVIIGDDGTIQFQAEAAAFGFDWSSLFKIIFELLLSRFRG